MDKCYTLLSEPVAYFYCAKTCLGFVSLRNVRYIPGDAKSDDVASRFASCRMRGSVFAKCVLCKVLLFNYLIKDERWLRFSMTLPLN